MAKKTKKQKTTMEKLTKIVTWFMLTALIVSAGLTLYLALAQYLK